MKDSISRQSKTWPKTLQSEALGISASGQLLPVATRCLGRFLPFVTGSYRPAADGGHRQKSAKSGQLE